MAYNGYKNYETWNVALYIQNDQSLYELAKEHESYTDFAESLREIDILETLDKVAFNDSGLDLERLNELIAEIEA